MKSGRAKKSLTIKSKLIVISILFLISISAIEILSTFSESKIKKAINLAELRETQLYTIAELKMVLVEFTLAGMDAINDKSSGTITEEIRQTMADASAYSRETLPKIKEMADTDKERELVQEAITIYPGLEKAIKQDLPKLIKDAAEQEAFDQIDDLIDGLHDKIIAPLEAIVESVQKDSIDATIALNSQMQTTTTLRRTFISVMLLVVGGAIFLVGRGILQPIFAARDMIQDVAEGEGDLTKRLVESGDEMGELSGWFNDFIKKLHGIISQIHKNLETLNSSSTDLNLLAKSLATDSENATERANNVAAAAEEMSANMNTVAASSEQASVNVNMVAAAAEEMSATVEEIAGNAANARQIAEQAVSKTGKASEQVNELGSAANEISKVTEVITEISEQTNLLALNATIEAARAGEAGKGFAVVANEIKELAKQTAEATLEIRQKIEAIQGSTDLTITEINEIHSIINETNDIVSTIATAVEEQSVSTTEISTNVAQAAEGISEVNENVSNSSSVSSEISQEISIVSNVAGQVQKNSNKINKQSGDLQSLADQLSSIVNQFKL